MIDKSNSLSKIQEDFKVLENMCNDVAKQNDAYKTNLKFKNEILQRFKDLDNIQDRFLFEKEYKSILLDLEKGLQSNNEITHSKQKERKRKLSYIKNLKLSDKHFEMLRNIIMYSLDSDCSCMTCKAVRGFGATIVKDNKISIEDSKIQKVNSDS